MSNLYQQYIKNNLPKKLQNRLSMVRGFFRHIQRPLRTKKITTRIFGPQYKRSRQRIEIDITYNCNLRCANCNRSCGQAPTGEMMSLEQIEKFIKESIDNNIKWELISVVGGEPTMHPDILKVSGLLLDYKNIYSPKTIIQLVTNGCGLKVNEVLGNLSSEIKILNSSKTDSSGTGFESFNIAPIDTEVFRRADFTNGCKIMKYCGMGLNSYGYYPCAVAGGIDRIFGLDKGRKVLPEKGDDLNDQLAIFCSLCGHFKECKASEGKQISHVWEKAYERYKKEKPILEKY